MQKEFHLSDTSSILVSSRTLAGMIVGAVAFGLVLQKVDKKHHAASVGHVMDRIHNHQARLPLGNVINQLFGGAWCLATGQSVGREGPAVHLGAGSGSLLGQCWACAAGVISTDCQ